MHKTIPDTLKILVVEDDEDDFFIISDYLKNVRQWKSEVVWISKYADAVAALCTNNFTLCFSDYRLGAKNGIDLLNDIKACGCNTPVILLTGKGNYEIDIEATKAGAFDYLMKSDLDEDKLERTIRYTVERLSNLQKIKASERKYRNIFEKSKDIAFIADMKGYILTINYAVTEILEISIEEAVGKKVSAFFKDPEQAAVFEQNLLSNGEIENFETLLIADRKNIKTCLISASIELDSEGKQYIQGIIHDITSLKKAELASLHAEKLAATGRFIRTLAHEVRNPLNNINLSIENLLIHPYNEEDKVYLEIIERNSKRINDLITELLQSSRLADMKIQQVSIKAIVEKVIKLIEDKLILRKIKLHFLPEPSLDYPIQGDHTKLEIALLNIFVNAVEAVDENSGIIEVSLVEKDTYTILTICDNGCGMTSETKARLFEPYFTLKRNGLGLGLATTLTILNAHQAAIEVNTQVSNGTCFEIRFMNTSNTPIELN